MKGRKARGSLFAGSDQKLLESPKMPLIKDPKAHLHLYQISGKNLLSPQETHIKENSFKLPAIRTSLQDIEEIGHEIHDNITWKNQKQDLKRCIGKLHGNLNKQNSWNSNFSLNSVPPVASPVSKLPKKQAVKASEVNVQKSIPTALYSKHVEEDPILRDLQASIQAENEIREIFSKKKRSQQHFKPPVLQSNFSYVAVDSRKFQKEMGCPFSPPKRLSINPMVHDKQFQVLQQHDTFQAKLVFPRGSHLTKVHSIKELSSQADQIFQKRDRIFSLAEDDDWSNTNYSKASTSISMKSDCDEKRVEGEGMWEGENMMKLYNMCSQKIQEPTTNQKQTTSNKKPIQIRH